MRPLQKAARGAPDQPGASVYRLRDVRKRREKGGVAFELHVGFLEILQGEFVAVFGPSGCGKSTLLDLLALVLHPSSGRELSICVPGDSGMPLEDTIVMNDVELANIRKSQVGYVLQSGGLLPFLNVRDNILLSCRINGMDHEEERVLGLARRLGIADQLKKNPSHLSAGQRQRVAIARALAHRPPIVLADEPTASVDRLTAEEIRNTFRDLTREMGVSLLMVTHDESLVSGAVDRTLYFNVRRRGARETFSTVEERN